MSGGVDSAVAAYLLKKEGHEVVGVTLRTWEADSGEHSRCCEIDDARLVSQILGIDYHVINCAREFKEKVTAPFIESYIHGMTPNPCTGCNSGVKWEKMQYMAKVLEADLIATGHYACIERSEGGRYAVKKAFHAEKDQTYMLYRLSQEQLAMTVMPLGRLSKQEVRQIAREAGIPVAEKQDSQEICFVTDGDYAEYIEKNADQPIPGPGNFVDEEGNILGVHKGITHYTVGQRKGLGLAMGYPAYVKQIRPQSDEVVISVEESLFSDELLCDEINFMSIPPLEVGESFRCRAKIRYHHKGEAAVVERTGDDRIRIRFDSPVRAAAPGQACVFYDSEDRVAGGGRIL